MFRKYISEMSLPAKKEKRRIVPTQVFEEEKKKEVEPPQKMDRWDRTEERHLKRAGMEGGQSTKYKKHLEAMHSDKNYIANLQKRAVALGYGKVSNAPKRQSKKRSEPHVDHGDHHEHMGSFKDFVTAFAKMKTHSKGVSMYEYLKRNFEKGLYMSSQTKRWRKAH